MHAARFLALTIGCAAAAASEHAAAQSFASPVTIAASIGSKSLGAAVNMNMSGVGSGANGPETAQFGTNMQCTKNNWIPTTIAGDLNCMSITVNQGAPNSDARAVAINVQNTGLGFSNGAEMVATTINTSNYSIPYYLDLQLANVFSDGTMAGAVFNSVTGAGAAGIAIDTQGSSSWTNLLQAAKNGKIYFEITGAGSILSSGTMTTAGLITSGAVKAASYPVSPLPESRVLRMANCGTTVRSTDSKPLTLLVPSGLPTGCQVDVIQIGTGSIRLEGRGLRAEHLGTPDQQILQTSGPSAEATLLIDTPHTFLLRGDVGVSNPKGVSFVSDEHLAGSDLLSFDR